MPLYQARQARRKSLPVSRQQGKKYSPPHEYSRALASLAFHRPRVDNAVHKHFPSPPFKEKQNKTYTHKQYGYAVLGMTKITNTMYICTHKHKTCTTQYLSSPDPTAPPRPRWSGIEPAAPAAPAAAAGGTAPRAAEPAAPACFENHTSGSTFSTPCTTTKKSNLFLLHRHMAAF